MRITAVVRAAVLALVATSLASPAAHADPVELRYYMTNYWPGQVNAARVGGHDTTTWPPAADGLNDSAWCMGASLYEWGEYDQYELLARWDTSSIPDGAVVVQASVDFYGTIAAEGADPETTFAAQFVPDWYPAGLEDYSPRISENALVPESVAEVALEYQTGLSSGLNLEFADPSGVSATGVTAVRFGIDWQDAPTGRNYYCNAGPEFFLNVTYVVP